MDSYRSIYFTPEHLAFRDSVARFVDEQIIPHINQWETDGRLPSTLYQQAAELGLFGMGYPEELGGYEADPFYKVICTIEMARAGSGGLLANLFTQDIAIPPLVLDKQHPLREPVCTAVLAGEQRAALAITEPSGGSDVANIQTRAVRDGDDYVVNGSKTFITSGMDADWYTVAVRTGGEGAAGISLLLIPRDAPGFTRTPLKKMGWWCSDTATLYFDDCRIPASNRIGPENAGFPFIMQNFNNERLGLAAQAWGLANAAFEEALDWAQQRKTFGKPIIHHQVIRHKLTDMRTRLDAARAYLFEVTWMMSENKAKPSDLAQLKNHCTDLVEYIAPEAVQILGGAGYMQETKSERVYRETKVLSIGGGTREIMNELAARQHGWL